jgi:hypothetical protein
MEILSATVDGLFKGAIARQNYAQKTWLKCSIIKSIILEMLTKKAIY